MYCGIRALTTLEIGTLQGIMNNTIHNPLANRVQTKLDKAKMYERINAQNDTIKI
jgi:hypothetical protein